MDAGRWTFRGNWLEREQAPLPVEGKTLVAWSQDNWFTMITKLIFPDRPDLEVNHRPDVTLKYRGRLESQELQYTFVLQHSQLGQVEGEGWIAPTSIVQRFWVLDDRERRNGFETIHRVSPDRYHLSSGIMSGHNLVSTMEATLDRQKS